MSKNIIVVGGGAAGMLAAYFAAEAGNKITLLEKMKTWEENIYNRKRQMQPDQCVRCRGAFFKCKEQQ